LPLHFYFVYCSLKSGRNLVQNLGQPLGINVFYVVDKYTAVTLLFIHLPNGLCDLGPTMISEFVLSSGITLNPSFLETLLMMSDTCFAFACRILMIRISSLIPGMSKTGLCANIETHKLGIQIRINALL